MERGWHQRYQAPIQGHWQGRLDSAPHGQGRFFQIVKCHDLTEGVPLINGTGPAFAIIGFACDEGVKRNLGRIGAIEGPYEFRNALAKLPNHRTSAFELYDFGNITCDDGDLEAAQMAFANVITLLLNHHITPLAIGGGHEMAWAHFQGIDHACHRQPISIVNIDAHFDLRPLDDKHQGNSGTPFLQIAHYQQHHQVPFDYNCLGIQPTGNTQSLFNAAKQLGVQYVLAEDFFFKPEIAIALVEQIISKNNKIYLTICLDAFAESIAPGVSAPQCSGLLSWQIIPCLRKLIASKKVISYDIAELAPRYDENSKTARLAAVLASEILLGG